MLVNKMKTKIILVTMSLLFTVSWSLGSQKKIIALKFGQPAVSESEISRTLKSLVKVQGTGGLCQDGLYLITHFGDREDIFKKENQKAIDDPLINQTLRYCSVFSSSSDNSVLMGRNWDNQNVGSIIVSLYYPPGKYASISFSRAVDMGYPLNLDLEQIKSSELGHKLLLAPFYSMDGINEHGLTVAVTGVKMAKIKPQKSKEFVSITFLIRKILDEAKDIKEAVNLIENYIPFDLDVKTLVSQLSIVDSSGKSVILEYIDDQWRQVYTNKSWQVLTNRLVYKVPDFELRNKCWRYKSISESIENANGSVDWKAGMKIMQNVAQKGTTWSVVYSPTSKDIYFSVFQKWDKIYHLSLKQ